MAGGDVVLDRITQQPAERFDIQHSTVQIERSTRAETFDQQREDQNELHEN
jgi:hypothetical protein